MASATAYTTVKLAGAAYLIWLTTYAHLVDRARAMITAPRVKAWLERTTGAVLIALGVRVAVERR